MDRPREFVFDIPARPGIAIRDNADGPPVRPKDAATVILLRDAADGLEVFLQHRVRGMAFAGGMTVFPGGGVDPRDADASVAWAGPPPSWWGERFACDEGLARALVCAAVRETFEESGVLLAGTEDAVVADVAPYRAARKALESREISLAGFLADAGLTVRADLLRPYAHWVTPPEEPRRYDTRFFAAKLPEGQRADGATSEADAVGWQRPSAAIADAREGRRGLMPPTWLTLSELDECATAGEVLGEPRDIVKTIPKLVRDGEQVRVILDPTED
ncbi:NUDIX hydrolase [Amycolatopsis jiangsuensis]|uniref:8-oxo-dGTP pyrophosphatase MutT (NUDIX family) n=1 Tax=Amycolatopsis jiangsuensis TaxID=1181879 RepID=A0A840IYG3_9PSEU|nr:NUDIX domain-containing protein [Amycolatopsis jiangsuensis]MBB4687706.1 8-oxo-dGTP pyrophosphatase MutT (NUDIX family) [Amycolatopsis jiangsuensis]